MTGVVVGAGSSLGRRLLRFASSNAPDRARDGIGRQRRVILLERVGNQDVESAQRVQRFPQGFIPLPEGTGAPPVASRTSWMDFSKVRTAASRSAANVADKPCSTNSFFIDSASRRKPFPLSIRF